MTSDRRGFTLVETLVALAITALVTGAAFRAVARAASARAAVTATATTLDTARRAILALADEVDAAGPLVVAVSPGTQGSVLRWTAWEPEPRTVTVAVEDGRLIRRERSPLAPADAPPAPGVPLATRVVSFRVRAWDDGVWTGTWDAERPPPALALALEVTGEPPLEIHVTLPVTEAGG